MHPNFAFDLILPQGISKRKFNKALKGRFSNLSIFEIIEAFKVAGIDLYETIIIDSDTLDSKPLEQLDKELHN